LRGWDRQTHLRTGAQERLATALGLFSVGLGLTQLVAPRSLARFIGVRDDDETRTLMRTLGTRELASGIGILANDRPAGWMWSRVAGDAMDLALLGSAREGRDSDRNRLKASMAAVAGVTILDVICAQHLSAKSGPSGRVAPRTGARQRTHVQKTLTVNRPLEEVYSFWRNFENFPRFMRHIESVRVIDERRSHWTAKGPAGMTVEWEAEITSERPNELISWRSLEGSDVTNSGRVTFRPAPGNRGTEVRVEIEYSPPAGALGRAIAWMFGEEPEQQVREDLRRFKQLMETGEIPISEGPGLWRPAQPPSDPEEVLELAGVHR
jgi:uncharacterized membrane protein